MAMMPQCVQRVTCPYQACRPLARMSDAAQRLARPQSRGAAAACRSQRALKARLLRRFQRRNGRRAGGAVPL